MRVCQLFKVDESGYNLPAAPARTKSVVTRETPPRDYYYNPACHVTFWCRSFVAVLRTAGCKCSGAAAEGAVFVPEAPRRMLGICGAVRPVDGCGPQKNGPSKQRNEWAYYRHSISAAAQHRPYLICSDCICSRFTIYTTRNAACRAGRLESLHLPLPALENAMVMMITKTQKPDHLQAKLASASRKIFASPFLFTRVL